ncbi:MAG: patatin [Ilumatobacteraceae bacterium]|nr:patatin [Ilumatobacteraceae bacterium]
MSRALVLGGGGVAGIAWETGVLVGLADEGLDLRSADLVVGTSAGSTVAAQLTSGENFDALFARQLTSAEESGELEAQLDIEGITALFIGALKRSKTPLELRAAIGQASLSVDTVPEADRRAVIEHRLPRHAWPAGVDVRVVAVDAATGEVRTFSAADDVSMVDAVAASCAVPGVWPPVTIDGRRYIDGGVRSSTNADLAAGHDVILVLAPVDNVAGIADPDVVASIERLGEAATVLVVTPDAGSAEAIGTNVLDLATRAPAVNAGRAQGRRIAADVRSMWNPA